MNAGSIDSHHHATRAVTPIERVRQALHESRQSFLLAFDHAPVGMALISLAGHYLAVNEAMGVIIGYDGPPGDVIGSLEPPAAGHRMVLSEQARERLLVGDLLAWNEEHDFMTDSGRTVTVVTTATLLRGSDGEPIRYIAQVQDVTALREQESLLAKERRRVEEAQVIGRLGSWERDLTTDLTTWSPALFQLRGLDPADFTGDWSAATRLVHPDDRHRVQAVLGECARTGAPALVRYRATRADNGAERWFDARAAAIYEGSKIVAMAGTVVDVTEDVQAQAAATTASALQRAVVTASPDLTFVYDIENRSTVWANRSLAKMLGYRNRTSGDGGDALLEDLIFDVDRPQVAAALAAARAAVADDEVVQVNYRLLDATGAHRWFSRRTTALHRDEFGNVTQLVGVLRDITDAMAVEQRLQHAALYDQLTGLPNRALLIDRLDGALTRSGQDHREVSVLFCDLDGFKRVNDTAGHAAGDAVLLETARRLQRVLRDGDTVARVGGDEFVIIVEPWNRTEFNGTATDVTDIDADRKLGPRIADRIAAAFRDPVEYHGVDHFVSLSIGITYGTVSLAGQPRAITADGVLQDADAAMYQAKRHGKDRYRVFEHGMRTNLLERSRVEAALREALGVAQEPPSAAGDGPGPSPSRLFAAYQPIFESRTGRLVAFEALARLTDAEHVSIPPDVFIRVAEETGLIRPLGTAMLELACSQLQAWRARTPGLTGVTIAVNVSALEVGHKSLSEEVRHSLSAHHLVPGDLVLELKESALLQFGHTTMAVLRRLRDEGIGIAMDGFGADYASLRHLATLPVSAVKIDKSFTAGLPADMVSHKMIGAIAGLAAELGLACTVEGVETEVQRRALPEGVRLQGFLTGRPQLPELLDLPGLTGHPVVVR